MDKSKRYELANLIKKKSGMSMSEYCRNVLEVNERTFSYRLRTGQIKIIDALTIMELTGMSFEALFERYAKHTNTYNARRTPDASKESTPPQDQEEELFIDIEI